MDDLPTIEEELTRKSLGELSRLLSDYAAGRISKREVELCFEVLWNCVSGLVKEDFFNLVNQAGLYLKTQPADPPAAVVFRKGDQTIVLSWKAGDEQVTATQLGLFPKAKLYTFATEAKPTAAARDHYKKLIAKTAASCTSHLEVKCA